MENYPEEAWGWIRQGDGDWQEDGPYYGDEDIKQDEMRSDSECVSESIEKLMDAVSLLHGIEDGVAMDLIHIIDKLKIEWDIEE